MFSDRPDKNWLRRKHEEDEGSCFPWVWREVGWLGDVPSPVRNELLGGGCWLLAPWTREALAFASFCRRTRRLFSFWFFVEGKSVAVG